MDYIAIGKKGCSMIHASSGVKGVDVTIWHDTPWLHVSPYEGSDETFFEFFGTRRPSGDRKSLGWESVGFDAS